MHINPFSSLETVVRQFVLQKMGKKFTFLQENPPNFPQTKRTLHYPTWPDTLFQASENLNWQILFRFDNYKSFFESFLICAKRNSLHSSLKVNEEISATTIKYIVIISSSKHYLRNIKAYLDSLACDSTPPFPSRTEFRFYLHQIKLLTLDFWKNNTQYTIQEKKLQV